MGEKGQMLVSIGAIAQSPREVWALLHPSIIFYTFVLLFFSLVDTALYICSLHKLSLPPELISDSHVRTCTSW